MDHHVHIRSQSQEETVQPIRKKRNEKKNKGTRRTKGNEEQLKNHELGDIYNLPG
jgi:hypothetical protein